ncbi:MAG: insulinase family protein, partial [bacterium]|nr:insulinase family protein [bacterium]
QSGIEIRYRTVPFGHRDAAALGVLGRILSGPTGRLHQALVLEQRIASRVGGGQVARKWAGAFYIDAETRGETTPAELEQAWYRELRRIQQEPIAADELRKVKNRTIANSYRALREAHAIAIRLSFFEGMGDWTHLNHWAEKVLAVEAEDVRRVANTYFSRNNRMVAFFHRQAAGDETVGGGS